MILGDILDTERLDGVRTASNPRFVFHAPRL
jgi:FlaA1/EpsC-like NDP-sugar epimerase